ncbi:MAG: hypothetical protein UZ05_CHB002003063 [Chlorobi bacterium OLB5]|nr:MAG: hypothetical protein UZ05_CHB002003063 [Chlorobi bacterium OLB5]
MKIKIFLLVFLIFVISSLFLSTSVSAQDIDRFNVKVLENMSEDPAANVWVLLKQNGITMYSGLTNTSGYATFNPQNGTYDIYAYYPEIPPNVVQSAQKLGHIINGPETVKLQLGPPYKD